MAAYSFAASLGCWHWFAAASSCSYQPLFAGWVRQRERPPAPSEKFLPPSDVETEGGAGCAVGNRTFSISKSRCQLVGCYKVTGSFLDGNIFSNNPILLTAKKRSINCKVSCLLISRSGLMQSCVSSHHSSNAFSSLTYIRDLERKYVDKVLY